MNPRIFKKLTKRAALLVEQLNDFNHLTKIVVGQNCVESTEMGSNWICRKYRDKFGYAQQLDGTVGFGAVSGYYEPEWDDTDALSILYEWYIEIHADYSEYPKYVSSLSDSEHTWKHALSYAEKQITTQ